MGNRLIDLQNITKIYDGHPVLDDLNLYFNENEFLTLLGPSAAVRPQRFGFWAVLKPLTRDASYSTDRILPFFLPTSAS